LRVEDKRLTAGKSRRAINTDPNNTKWTRDTSTFGQKILRSQGWQPGQFLGAQDAPHSNLHTSANASYIRVSLKDDMKGLGFDKAKDNEATGMDVFNDLLSRLNGKSAAAIAEDRQARLVVKMHQYVEQKWGPMRFVRGGLLVGDELKVDEEDAQKNGELEPKRPEAGSELRKEKMSKKRKAASLNDDEDDGGETVASDSDSNSKKRKKEARKSKKRSKEADASDPNESQDDSSKSKKKDKKDKKIKKQKKEKASEKEDDDSNDDSADDKMSKRKSKSQSQGYTASLSDDEAAKARKKKEKKERKEKRKEEKKQKKSRVESSSSSASGTSTPTAATEGTPAGSGTSIPRRNPHLVRSRFIAAKREALLDDKALKQVSLLDKHAVSATSANHSQILMIKT
jgi:Pin2-interacting protein X1